MVQSLKAILSVVTGVMLFAAIPPCAAQDIKVGYNSDMSAGGSSEFGISGLYGLEEAAEEINKSGGVLGRKIVVVPRDDTGQPPKAIQNTSELVDNEKVIAMFGGANSGTVLAWMHIPQQKQIPVISPIATATEITKRYQATDANYMFRISMVDREQIALLMAYAMRATKDKKIAFLVDSTGYGQQALKDLKSVIALHGMSAAAEEKFGPKDTDMTSQLNKIRSAGADTVIVIGLADANAQVMRSMEKISYFPVVLGSWANINTPLNTIAGQDLAGRIIFTASVTPDSTPKAAELYSRLIAKHPNMPTFITAAQSYDSLIVLAQAIKQAGGTDGAKIQNALENLQKVEGVIKTYDKPFSKTNHEGMSVNDFHLAKWQDGKIVTYADEITRAIQPADLKR
ncbi:MAG: ABC transporter substrate-binding protein [Candidatus Afipia apatlaquensis]|jgi:branched-chain amino acid transport system substrate-binding protein|uniref:ABC transporter substrate-binding protein n=1 Tax=Candidatus Afipia apatlaquensis TaxID=2712852 RepID=A0A7C9RDQ8_9BRAD|nr:ABC transporter substrate-binding protein [Candidatus Afipia apatlaquensis]